MGRYDALLQIAIRLVDSDGQVVLFGIETRTILLDFKFAFSLLSMIWLWFD